MAKSRGRKFAEITSPSSGVFDLTSVPTITNAKLQNSAMTLAGSSVSLGGTGVANTDALSEGSSNVYFTDARVQTFLGGGTLAGNIVVPDNRSIYLGSNSDFRLVHNTSDTQLINATGELQITSNGGFAVTGATTFSADLTVDTDTLKVDSTNNRVGIGTTTPTTILELKSASATAGLSITGGNSNTSDINLGDTDDINIQRIRSDHSDNSLQFFTNNAERVRIDSSGNVGIGQTPASTVVLDVKEANAATDALLGLTAGTGGRAQIRSVAQSDATSSVLSFHTMSGSSTNERMRIDSSGTLKLNQADSMIMTNANTSRLRLFGGSSNSVSNGAALTLQGVSHSGGNYADLASGSGGHIQFRIGTSEKLRINSDGNVGIGEPSPLGTLHVRSTDSGATADVSADDLVVENNSNTGISILSGASSTGSIYFGDSGRNWDGYIAYSHGTSPTMTIASNGGGTYLKMNSTGSMGIGVTPSASHYKTLEIGTVGSGITGRGAADTHILSGLYWDGASTRKYAVSGVAVGTYQITNGVHYWSSPASGTAGNTATVSANMTLDASGNLGINQTTPAAKLDIKGDTTTYGGMAKIYLTDTASNSESRNWAIGNGGSGFGHFTIGRSVSKNGDPMASGTHTTPFVIDHQDNVGVGATSPSQKLHVAGATKFEDDEVYQDTGDNFVGGLVFETPIYKEYQYSWSGTNDHETNVYTPSYFMSEIVFTQHQTNGGSDINRHFVGKFANNHTHHELETIHDSGSTWSMSTTMTATDHNLSSGGANGRLRIVETYGSGSYSKSTLTIRVYFGTISNITHTFG